MTQRIIEEGAERRKEEARTLIDLILESDKSCLSSSESNFVGRVMIKLKSNYSTFSNKEIYWLRDIKDKCL